MASVLIFTSITKCFLVFTLIFPMRTIFTKLLGLGEDKLSAFQLIAAFLRFLFSDGGFVVLQGTTYWTDLFVRHFLFQSDSDSSIDSDDLLFFVRKKHVKGTSRHMPKYETDVDVYRKDSRKLPIGDPDVDWEETVYLNLIIHQFNYTLTLAICTRTSPKELQVLRRHSQRVYASPSRRKMDTKGDGEEMTYPHICFMVDNFDEVSAANIHF